MYTNEELEKLTLQWGEDRKITTNGTLQAQFIKLVEEHGEFFDSNGDNEEIKDSIGDMIVVLVMMNGILTRSFLNTDSVLGRDYPASLLGKMASTISRKNDVDTAVVIDAMFSLLHKIAEFHNLTINECWNYA